MEICKNLDNSILELLDTLYKANICKQDVRIYKTEVRI